MKHEPERWSPASADAPEAFTYAKRLYRDEGPSAVQFERMLERLEPGADASESAEEATRQAAPSPSIRGHGSGYGWKAVLLGVLAAGWMFAAHQMAKPNADDASREKAQGTRAAAAASPPVHDELAQNAPASPALPAVVEPARQASPTPRPTAKRVLPRQPESMNPLDELSLLQRARRILHADPARALALTQEHAVHYQGGVLREERELLAIEALVKLGRGTQAEQRAGAFLRAHPRSVHQQRIQAILHAAQH